MPLSWLGEHVSLEGVSPEALSERLTNAGIEIETVEGLGALHPDVVVGVILALDEVRPGVWFLDVDVGRVVQLTSRAPNLAGVGPGQRVAVSLPGAMVFELGEGDGLKTRKMTARESYGRVSEGMLCSARELGLGEDRSGILLLDGAMTAGQPLAAALGLDGGPVAGRIADRVLHIGILPNIARCQSVLGVAREVGALLDRPTRLEVDLEPLVVGSSALDPSAEDVEVCGRFGVVLLEGVVVGPSPRWLRERLVVAGSQPINNVVDASNYAMLELGQPTHAYDAAKLPSLQLRVRGAEAGEAFLPLMREEGDPAVAVAKGAPFISSAGRPVALAGVMGGWESRVTEETRSVLLESANFDLIAIRRSQAAAQIFTDSSARFSRGVDPALVEIGLRRIIALLRQTCPALRVVGTGLWSPRPPVRREIRLPFQDIGAALGVDLPVERVTELLGKVDVEAIVEEGGTLVVRVPSARQDLLLPCDLLEEVARLGGYDAMPATMPAEPVPNHPPSRRLAVRDRVIDHLVAAGLQETVTYSLSSADLEAKLGLGRPVVPPPPYLRLVNPISAERSVMRRTLQAHLLETLRLNLGSPGGCQIFEVGVVVLPEAPGVNPGLPGEGERVSLALLGASAPPTLHEPEPRALDFYDLSRVVLDLCQHLHIDGAALEPADEAPFHPGLCARLVAGGRTLGHLGAVHPAVALGFDLGKRRILLAELDLDALLDAEHRYHRVQGLPRFPAIELDVAVVADETLLASELVRVAQGAAGAAAGGFTVFDVYRGEPMSADKKAIGLRFRLSHPDRTLTMDEAVAVRAGVVAALESQLGVVLRGA